MEDLTSRIDQYLSGEMSSEDRQLFENEMESNEDLRTEVDLQSKVVALLDEKAWVDAKDQVAELNNKKRTSSPYVQLLKIAAIVALIVLPTYYVIHTQYSDQNLYVSYYSEYPDHITTMGDSDNKMDKAMSLYNSGEFEGAAKRFKELRLTGDSTLIIYEAISLTQNGDPDSAIFLLEAVLKTNPENVSTYQWQLILTYLANDQGDKALELLRDYVKKPDGYQIERAKELLDDLNSFWR